MRRMTIGLVAGVLAAGAAATAGWTQISPGSEPFMVGSDEFELIQQEGVQIWRGRAEATQGENRLRAGEIRVYHDVQDGGFGQAQRIEATGEVFFVTPEQVARGDRAVYTAATDTLVVTGDVILRQGENVLTGSIQLPLAQYRDEGSVTVMWDELTRRLEALPGVSGVAFADGRPPADVADFNNFDLEAHPTPAGQSQPVTPWLAVTPEYFGVLGLPLLEGRLRRGRRGRRGPQRRP